MNNPHPNNPNTNTDTNTATTKNKPAYINPRTWTKQTQIITASTALILTLAGTGAGYTYHNYTITRDCKVQTKLFTEQKSDFVKTLQKAKDALKTIDTTLEIKEGDRLAHTDGFPASSEEKKTTHELNQALNQVNKHTKDEPLQCSSSRTLKAFTNLTQSRQNHLNNLDSKLKAFTNARDKYRLNKASKEAKNMMEQAKTDLANAQKEATDQIAIVDANTALQNDNNIKTAYNTLKKTEKDSRTISTTITTTTYNNAITSIGNAKKLAEKTTELTAATQTLKNTIQAYHNTKTTTTPRTSNRTPGNYNTHSYAYNYGNTAPNYTSNSGNSSSNPADSGLGSGNYYNPLPGDADVLHMSLDEIEADLKAKCGPNYEKCQ